MTLNQVYDILLNYFKHAEIEINCMVIEGFYYEEKIIRKLEISLDGLSVYNILEEIIIILDDFEYKYGINVISRYVEF